MVFLIIPCVRKSAKNQSSGSRSRACACHRLGKSAGWRFNEYPNVSRCVSSMRCRLTASTSACRYLSSSNMPRDDVNASNTVCEAGVTVVFHVTPCLTRLRVGVAMQVLRLVYVPMWLSSNTVAPPTGRRPAPRRPVRANLVRSQSMFSASSLSGYPVSAAPETASRPRDDMRASGGPAHDRPPDRLVHVLRAFHLTSPIAFASSTSRARISA